MFEDNKSEWESGHAVLLMQIDKDREANVSDAAIEALGALLAHLPWLQYEQLLNQWLKVMKKTPTKVQATLSFASQAHSICTGL